MDCCGVAGEEDAGGVHMEELVSLSFVFHIEFFLLVLQNKALVLALLGFRLILAAFFLLLLAFVFGSTVLKPNFDLCLGEVEGLGELLPLGAHHVLVLLKGLLQLQQLTRAERRPDSLGLPEGQQEGGEVMTAGESWREDPAVAGE